MNTNGNAFVRITKKNRNVFYVNEYIGHESFGIHMDNDKLAEYVYSKFASNWRANLIINLLIVGKDYEHAGNIADCYKVVG